MREINTVWTRTRPELRTHINYVKCLARITEDLEITLKSQDQGELEKPPELEKFKKLADITKKAIDSDIDLCKETIEHARICTPWLSIKIYYRIYYLESILLYLIDSNESAFRNSGSHSRVSKHINEHIKSGKIICHSNEGLPKVRTVKECKKFSIEPGENIKNDYWLKDRCADSVMAKIAKHKIKNYIQKNADMSSLDDQNVFIFDYFYMMRLKANYDNVDFLNLETAEIRDINDYVLNLFKFYKAYDRSLCTIIREQCGRLVN